MDAVFSSARENGLVRAASLKCDAQLGLRETGYSGIGEKHIRCKLVLILSQRAENARMGADAEFLGQVNRSEDRSAQVPVPQRVRLGPHRLRSGNAGHSPHPGDAGTNTENLGAEAKGASLEHAERHAEVNHAKGLFELPF